MHISPPSSPLRLTPEQAAVANETSTSGVTQVRAYAGTGKTKTLEERVMRRPSGKTLYVVFGKAVQLAARRRMPKRVDVFTSHSMAYSSVGVGYRHKLVPDLHVRSLLRLPEVREVMNGDRHAKLLLTTLTNWFSSPERELSSIHVPVADSDISHGGSEPNDPWKVSAAAMVHCARAVWKRMRDANDHEVPMLHDGYFKEWACRDPRLGYDEILMDEAQDTSRALAAVIAAQTHAQRVLVGDPYQSIFGFRGARDAMQGLPADRVFRLTQSFRFGEAVANVGSAVLRLLGEHVPLRGDPRRQSRCELIPADDPHTFLSRTNAGVIANAINAVAQDWKIHFVGGVKGYPFTELLDAYHLFSGDRGKIVDPGMRAHFRSFDDFEAYVTDADERGKKKLVSLVKEHGHEIPDLVGRVTSAAVEREEQARLVLSTLHKAKGLEWPRVRLDDDFPTLVDPRNGFVLDRFKTPDGRQEAHMIYIAATRAQEVLDYTGCSGLLRVLDTDSMRVQRHAQKAAGRERHDDHQVEETLNRHGVWIGPGSSAHGDQHDSPISIGAGTEPGTRSRMCA